MTLFPDVVEGNDDDDDDEPTMGNPPIDADA